MNRSKKKSFDWYGMRQRFSIRKYHIGAASVLLGTTLVLGTGTIVGAETGVNGDGASNGQIVPVNNDGISDGTQPQGDNQGNNSSGVQTGNTTNSTANVQPAGDTGPASGQPVVNPRTMALTPEGDGLTNQPVAEPIMIIPSSASEPAPKGYVTVTFAAANKYAKGFTLGNQTGSSVKVFVKENVKWGTLLDDPAWQWPTVTTDPGDIVVGWAVNISASETSYKNKAFSREKYKDTVVTDTKLYPNVVYEVEEVGSRTKDEYLALYGPDEQDKWIFIKFDAGQGSMTYDKKQYTSRSVAAYFQSIGYDNSLFTSKVVSPTLANHTFVRWQTEDGTVLPKTGTIAKNETYTALYLTHPAEKTAVFNEQQLTATEKERLIQAIYDANPNSTGLIESITVSETGAATVIYNDGTTVIVQATDLITEDKDTARSLAKADIERAAIEKKDEINASNFTDEEKAEKIKEVEAAQNTANNAIDAAATTDELEKALTEGKATIEGIDTTTSAKKADAKKNLEDVYNAKKDAITNSGLTAEEKATKQAELDKAKADAEKAIDAATDNAGVDTALNKGKADIAAIDTSASPKKAAAKQDLEEAYNAKKDAITNSGLTAEEKATKQAELDKAKETAENAIDTATDDAGVDTALNKGKVDIAAFDTSASPKKATAKQDLEEAYNAKKAEIENSVLTAEEKAAKQAELDKAKETAENAIDTATDDAGVDTALNKGKADIAAFDTSASPKKATAKQDLEEAYNAKKAEIENSVLTADEKVAKQAELTKAKENAIKAVDDATTDSAVEGALTNGKAAIESTYTAIIKIPSSASEKAPKGYVTVSFNKTPYTKGFTLGTQTGESVKVFVKENVKWGTLLDDPAWQWPTVKTAQYDTVVGWGVNVSSQDNAYKPGNAFARDKYKDIVVTDTKLYPNVVFEVEDVNYPTKQDYLALLYGPDEQDKWIFITFDAGKGSLSGSKTSKMVAVSKNLYSIDFSNKKFKEKVESPTLQGHTFVRWQTDAGEVLPERGEITTDTTYEALYLAHPTDKTVVFDANKLTETEKDSLKQAINNANTDSANFIQSITVSDTGEATVTYNDGTVVTVPASHLINEDKEPARNLAKEEIDDKLAEEKAAIEAKRDAAIAEINNTPGLTDDQKQAATDAVTNTANDALTALDTAADDAKKAIDTKTTAADFNDAKTAGEKALDDATAKGEAAIELTKDKELAKADVDNQAKDAIEAIKNNPNLDATEQAPYIEAIEKAAEEQKAAIDAAKDTAGITDAVDAAEKVNEEQKLAAAKQDAKNKIAKDVEAANAAIESNPNLSEKEIADAKAEVAKAAEEAKKAIDAATTPEAAQAAEEAGTKAIAEDVLDAAKQDAKNKIAKDLATVEAAIDANSNLSEDEKKAAKLAAQAKAAEAVANIEKAATPEAVQTLEDAAVKDLANIEIKAAYDDAVKAIEAADNLSTAAKTQALEDLKKARQAAEEAIKTASTADEVAKGALDGLKSIAKVEAKAAADDAKAAIAQNSNLTDAEKKVYTDAIDNALKDTETKIDAATDADTVDAETVLAQKDIAKQEVAAATADAVKGIEANTNLTDAEKDEYKATVTKAAETAEKAIADATTAADIQSKTFDATQDVAKEEVKADAADAVKGIQANDNLSDTAKAEAVAAIEEARNTTLENIENAKTAAEVDTATLDAEKANAKAEIKAAADDAKKA
ncbi:TPA: DUF1542 domain-containing protein, partial [Streptococcus suis]|nr:DUF1542 domain-containing protein [Streptococcus suis]